MPTPSTHPVRVLQFGGGNFLRAFFDWMVQGLNDRCGYAGAVRLTKAAPGPFPPAFARQGYSYHVVVRGNENGAPVRRRERVSCIAGASNAYTDFDAFWRDAADPALQVIVSNTTEAGLAYSEADAAGDRPARSFPGKLTQLLRARYLALGGGESSSLVIVPCELVEKNGATLRGFVRDHARRFYGDAAFESWLTGRCTWLDTLVDRIVPGHDAKERAACLAETGVDDELLVVAEPYHLLVLEGPEREDVLPLRKAGFNVVWTSDLAPYRTRKVRILNGGHTFMAMIGLGLGVGSVGEAVAHPLLGRALLAFYAREVRPALLGSQQELEAYEQAVLDRFANPFVVHKLADIALNSAAKLVTRVLPTARDHLARTGEAPALSAFAVAALLDRYLYGEGVVDSPAVLARFRDIAAAHGSDPGAAADAALSSADIFGAGVELPAPLRACARSSLVRIREVGMSQALGELL